MNGYCADLQVTDELLSSVSTRMDLPHDVDVHLFRRLHDSLTTRTIFYDDL